MNRKVPPHVLHRTVSADEALTGYPADCIDLAMPAGEARLVLDLIGADLPIWEADPDARAGATLTLDQAKELSARIRRALVLALWESIT